MTLRIHIDRWQDASSPCAWAQIDEAGAMRASGHDALADMPPDDDAILIFAAPHVLATMATLPKIKRSKLETALPYALEDSLLDDAATMHVTLGPKLSDGSNVLYAIDRDWLTQLLAAARSAKIRVRRAVPEYCLLPLRNEEWSLAWSGSQGFLSTASSMGLALDSGDNLRSPTALQLRLRQSPPAALRLFALGSEIAQPQWGLGIPLIFERQSFDWRKVNIPATAPNLLWGKFAPPPRLREFWPWLRPALLAGLLLFSVEAVLSNLEWALFALEKRTLNNHMEQVFRETFGAEAVIVDAPLQMRRNVANLRHAAGTADDADFLPLLDRFAAIAETQPGLRQRTVRYADGKLDVELALPGKAALDSLQQRLAETGLMVQLTDSQESGAETVVQLHISSGGVR